MASPTPAVLAIDTAGPVVCAATATPHGVDGWSAAVVRGADSVLLPAIATLLERLDGELVAVGVSVGPGAFTGLRVGVATALGIAVSRGVPVVPLSSLEVRAAMVVGPRVLAMLDARKKRVYAGLFDCRDDPPRPLDAERDVDPVLAQPGGSYLAVGQGAVAYRGAVEAGGGVVVADAGRAPAEECARLTLARRHTAVPASQIALRYLRPPDAQVPRDLRADGPPRTSTGR